MGTEAKTLENPDIEKQYARVCEELPENCQVIVQNTYRVQPFSELFYAAVTVTGSLQLRGMLDTGSMACTISEEVEQKLLDQCMLSQGRIPADRIVLVGCGGQQVCPRGVYSVELGLCGVKCLVTVLVVPGQKDDIIIGSNVLKCVIHQMKTDDNYCKLVTREEQEETECEDYSRSVGESYQMEKW